ncbi:RecQ family ATP-dependent DNA helicase [Bacteroides ovatus]|uniref:DNA 3'-5' helicase n=1 Tax=Bacteroides ovatus TaxID=28116 RepID=A0A1G8CMV2_BACOV|nr:RecQ family ATP-dependent DNA helicase [Bacteroides ovatus]SDH46897.1 ATP-dependent DNA helicase, RecQ-like [Bacteroides ovatus]
MITREQAEVTLKQVFGLEHFFDEQWNTIERLLNGERMLLIECTGFGKSLCYQFPAVLLDGVTIIFSPLIALMRDQVKNLNKRNIPARYINSEQTPEENTQAIQDTLDGLVKILYIAPERQENQEWIEATRQMKLAMVVIDEARTISVWGHDFRPAFRRIINLVNLLPKTMPILATTATATLRVQQDIERQIGGNLQTIRGNLVRDNFHLYVVETKSENEKMIGLAHWLDQMPGTGLIYVGTRVQTEQYANWLTSEGINCVAYHAGLASDQRKDIETGLMDNRWKCVISTNALGMGIDKPDIRFIIHTQIPASPIHYYQEIGRAGRDGKPTTALLFYNSATDAKGVEEDYKLPLSFITSARPSIDKYRKVIELLQEEPLGLFDLMRKTNLKQTPVNTIKADLIEQNIIKEVIYSGHKKYEYQFGANDLNTENFEALRAAKLKDLDKMVEYVYSKAPRMKFLCEFLGDFNLDYYKNCDNTTLKKLHINMSKDDLQRITLFWENYFPILSVENSKSNLINGVAGAYYGTSNVGNLIHRSKYEGGGDFPDFLQEITLRAFRKHYANKEFDLILYVPPTVSGELVRNFAYKVGNALKIPVSDLLIKTHETEAQKVFQNNVLKKDNVIDSFTITEPDLIQGKRILLIDDIYDSGATIKEIGKLLTKMEAVEIAPLVIAKTIGGDDI